MILAAKIIDVRKKAGLSPFGESPAKKQGARPGELRPQRLTPVSPNGSELDLQLLADDQVIGILDVVPGH